MAVQGATLSRTALYSDPCCAWGFWSLEAADRPVSGFRPLRDSDAKRNWPHRLIT